MKATKKKDTHKSMDEIIKERRKFEMSKRRINSLDVRTLKKELRQTLRTMYHLDGLLDQALKRKAA